MNIAHLPYLPTHLIRRQSGEVVDPKGRVWERGPVMRMDRCTACGSSAVLWYTMAGWDGYRVFLCDAHVRDEEQLTLLEVE